MFVRDKVTFYLRDGRRYAKKTDFEEACRKNREQQKNAPKLDFSMIRQLGELGEDPVGRN